LCVHDILAAERGKEIHRKVRARSAVGDPLGDTSVRNAIKCDRKHTTLVAQLIFIKQKKEMIPKTNRISSLSRNSSMSGMFEVFKTPYKDYLMKAMQVYKNVFLDKTYYSKEIITFQTKTICIFHFVLPNAECILRHLLNAFTF